MDDLWLVSLRLLNCKPFFRLTLFRRLKHVLFRLQHLRVKKCIAMKLLSVSFKHVKFFILPHFVVYFIDVRLFNCFLAVLQAFLLTFLIINAVVNLLHFV